MKKEDSLVDKYLASRDSLIIAASEKSEELKEIEKNHMLLSLDNKILIQEFTRNLYWLDRAKSFQEQNESAIQKILKHNIKSLIKERVLKRIYTEVVSLHFFISQPYIELTFSTEKVKNYFLSRFAENPLLIANNFKEDKNIVCMSITENKDNGTRGLIIPFSNIVSLNIFYQIFWRRLIWIGEKTMPKEGEKSSLPSLIMQLYSDSYYAGHGTIALNMACCKKSFDRPSSLYSLFFHKNSFMKTIFPKPLTEIIFNYDDGYDHYCDETDEECESMITSKSCLTM